MFNDLFWMLWETVGGARHGGRITLGMTTFEDAVANVLKAKEPEAEIIRHLKVVDSSRLGGRGTHDIDIVKVLPSSIIGYEIKSQEGIAYTVPGAHTRDADNMVEWKKKLALLFPGRKTDFIVIRRGGASVAEHSAAGIKTHSLSDYLTDDEIKKISENVDVILRRLKCHAKKWGLDLNDEDAIDSALLQLREALIEAGHRSFKK